MLVGVRVSVRVRVRVRIRVKVRAAGPLFNTVARSPRSQIEIRSQTLGFEGFSKSNIGLVTGFFKIGQRSFEAEGS